MPPLKTKTQATYIMYGPAAGCQKLPGSADIKIKKYSAKHAMIHIVSERILILLGQVSHLIKQYQAVEIEITDGARQLAERSGYQRAVNDDAPPLMPVSNDLRGLFFNLMAWLTEASLYSSKQSNSRTLTTGSKMLLQN